MVFEQSLLWIQLFITISMDSTFRSPKFENIQIQCTCSEKLYIDITGVEIYTTVNEKNFPTGFNLIVLSDVRAFLREAMDLYDNTAQEVFNGL